MQNRLTRGQLLQLAGLTVGSALLANGCSLLNLQEADVPTGQLAYANPNLLVETDWLERHQRNSNLRIIDIRKTQDYAASHVENAINIPASKFIDTDNSIKGMLIPPVKFSDLVGSSGIGNDQEVIVYGAGNVLWATRVFWAFELYGHKNAKVLNGGFAKWAEESRETTTELPSFPVATFKVDFDASRVGTIEEVQAAIEGTNINAVILDNRSEGEYAGRDVRANRGGHIPGAINQHWVVYLKGNDTLTFKSAAELTELFNSSGITENTLVYAHCQTAVRSSVAYFVSRLLGYNNIQNYDGSWSEWGNRQDTKINTGSSP